MDYCFKYRALSKALYDALAEDAFCQAVESSVSAGANQHREAMLHCGDHAMREADQYIVSICNKI